MEFEVLTGDALLPAPPPEKIRDLVARSDCVVVVGPRRDKIEGKAEWSAPAWVQNEIGLAYGASKPIALFLEDGVRAEGLGPGATTYARFERGDLSASAPTIVRYLWALRLKLAPGESSEGDPATMQALANEIGGALESLDGEKEEWTSPWFLSLMLSKMSGRLLMFSTELQERVERAYASLSAASGAAARVRQGKTESGAGGLFRSLPPAQGGRDAKADFDTAMAKAAEDGIIAILSLMKTSKPSDWEEMMQRFRGTKYAPLEKLFEEAIRSGKLAG